MPGQEPVENGVKVAEKADVSPASVDLSAAAGVDVARAGDKEKRKRKREESSYEPLLEGYASRHSVPESPCLAGVREATNKYVRMNSLQVLVWFRECFRIGYISRALLLLHMHVICSVLDVSQSIRRQRYVTLLNSDILSHD